ncbi:DoxX family protein [Trinickia mobilis]|uniref:DoxX family protein n=1 Tax=Trinickia mobilis TaxID=2816356 RepID=UPI002107EEEB|nr:DoxX family protein [Trinickia mobilis]
MIKTPAFSATLGRLLMSALFLSSGFGKLANPAGTKAYIAANGLPWPDLAYGVAIVIEVGFSVALVLGYRTRAVAAVMAIFTLVTGLAFHNDLSDSHQVINLLKNIAIAGGFLQVIVLGAGALSLDAFLASRRPLAQP